MTNPYALPIDGLPRVVRTPMLEKQMLVMDGSTFGDGKRRIGVPMSVSDEQASQLAAALIDADEKVERLTRMVAAVEALLAHKPTDP
jgi:hypothetical protein